MRVSVGAAIFQAPAAEVAAASLALHRKAAVEVQDSGAAPRVLALDGQDALDYVAAVPSDPLLLLAVGQAGCAGQSGLLQGLLLRLSSLPLESLLDFFLCANLYRLSSEQIRNEWV